MSKGRLSTVRPRVALQQERIGSLKVSARRMAGRALQDRRQRIWENNPHCEGCGRLVSFPAGFELDHRIPLYLGGADTDDNCQILCVYKAFEGGRVVKAGCHVAKTAADLKS